MIKLKALTNGRSYNVKPGNVREFLNDKVFSYRPRQSKASNGIRLCGIVGAILFGPDGGILNATAGLNLVTTAGRNAAIDRLQAAAVAVHDYIAIGTGATAAAAGDTTLQTEVARIQGTLSQPVATTDRCISTFAAGTGTGTIAETGRLNAASVGNLFGRFIFGSTINKTASDSLEVTYDFTV